MTVWAYKSGSYSTTLSSHHGLSDKDEVKAMLKRMDGTSFYSFCLWKVPEGIEFVDVDLKKYPQEYIQCAGSAKRMTVEVRTIDDGTIRHVVLGKKNRLPKLPASIKWEKLKTKVRTNEVFTAEDAGELFVAYYNNKPYPFAYTERVVKFADTIATK